MNNEFEPKAWVPVSISFLMMILTAGQLYFAWQARADTQTMRDEVVSLRLDLFDSAKELYDELGETIGVVSSVNGILHSTVEGASTHTRAVHTGKIEELAKRYDDRKKELEGRLKELRSNTNR